MKKEVKLLWALNFQFSALLRLFQTGLAVPGLRGRLWLFRVVLPSQGRAGGRRCHRAGEDGSGSWGHLAPSVLGDADGCGQASALQPQVLL